MGDSSLPQLCVVGTKWQAFVSEPEVKLTPLAKPASASCKHQKLPGKFIARSGRDLQPAELWFLTRLRHLFSIQLVVTLLPLPPLPSSSLCLWTCVKCTDMQAVAHVKGQGVTSVSVLTFVGGRISLLFVNSPGHSRLGGLQASGESPIPASPLPIGAPGVQACCALPSFTGVLGIWTLLLMLVQQGIYPLCHFSSPSGSSYIA